MQALKATLAGWATTLRLTVRAAGLGCTRRKGKAARYRSRRVAACSRRPLKETLIWEDSMSLRVVPAILTATVFLAFGFLPVDAQPSQSLRLYVLDCGIITPPNVDNYGFKPSEVAEMRMVTPCFLIVHPRGSLMWDTGEIPDSAFKDGVSPQKLNTFTVDRPLLPQLAAI